MSLKDRLKAKKENKTAEKNNTVYNISVEKICKSISEINNVSDLGNIVKEFSKFLNTLGPKNAQITLSGDFDMGQKILLNCILSNFIDEKTAQAIEKAKQEFEENEETETPKLIRKRKSVKARLAENSIED